MKSILQFFKRIFHHAEVVWEKNKTGVAITLLIVLFFFFYFWNAIVYTVDSGEMAVKWKRFANGTVLERVYGEGLQLCWPWDRLTIYDVRIQEVETHTYVYTSNGLALDVEASVRFYPRLDTLPELHQRLGPEYINKVVKPEIVSALRKVLGNYRPEEIYSMDEQGLLNDLRQIMMHEIVGDYIILSEFLLTRLSLPDTLQNSIQTKLTQEQRALAYDFVLDRERKEKQRRIIEAEGIQEFQRISGISILPWAGIEATKELATSNNAKVVVIGTDQGSLPVILNTGSDLSSSAGSGNLGANSPAGTGSTNPGAGTGNIGPGSNNPGSSFTNQGPASAANTGIPASDNPGPGTANRTSSGN